MGLSRAKIRMNDLIGLSRAKIRMNYKIGLQRASKNITRIKEINTNDLMGQLRLS